MIVDARNLDLWIGRHRILDGVSFHVGDGERVGLIGPSGSGKSMAASALLGLQPRQARETGSIEVCGRQIIGADRHDLADMRGRLAGIIFQNPATALNPVLTVGQQIALPLRLHYHLSRSDIRRRVLEMLDRVELPARTAGRYPSEISGGQQQRVAVAVALSASPRLVIADEPTTALDAITQHQIVDLLVSLVEGSATSLLFITHDFSVLARAVTRCYVLDQGCVVEEGPVDGIIASPKTETTEGLVRAAELLSFHRGKEGERDDDQR